MLKDEKKVWTNELFKTNLKLGDGRTRVKNAFASIELYFSRSIINTSKYFPTQIRSFEILFWLIAKIFG